MAGFVSAISLAGRNVSNLVIAGLDPAIHNDFQRALNFIMDAGAGKLAQPA